MKGVKKWDAIINFALIYIVKKKVFESPRKLSSLSEIG